jgi:peptide/nickel transport system permease protein
MATLIGRRLVALVAVLCGLAVIVFVLQAVIPSDPARAMVGASASPEAVAAKAHELGYDKPLPARFADYLGRTVQGDLQSSLRTRNDVADDLRTFAPATLELALAASILAGVIGIGLALALAGGGRTARVLRVVLVAGASVPGFLVGLLAILVFYSGLGILPASGRVTDTLVLPDGPTGLLLFDSLVAADPGVFLSALGHLVMPAFTLALVPALAIARTLATSLEQVMREDYVRTARRAGEPSRPMGRAPRGRNAAAPALARGVDRV